MNKKIPASRIFAVLVLIALIVLKVFSALSTPIFIIYFTAVSVCLYMIQNLTKVKKTETREIFFVISVAAIGVIAILIVPITIGFIS